MASPGIKIVLLAHLRRSCAAPQRVLTPKISRTYVFPLELVSLFRKMVPNIFYPLDFVLQALQYCAAWRLSGAGPGTRVMMVELLYSRDVLPVAGVGAGTAAVHVAIALLKYLNLKNCFKAFFRHIRVFYLSGTSAVCPCNVDVFQVSGIFSATVTVPYI